MPATIRYDLFPIFLSFKFRFYFIFVVFYFFFSIRISNVSVQMGVERQQRRIWEDSTTKNIVSTFIRKYKIYAVQSKAALALFIFADATVAADDAAKCKRSASLRQKKRIIRFTFPFRILFISFSFEEEIIAFVASLVVFLMNLPTLF